MGDRRRPRRRRFAPPALAALVLARAASAATFAFLHGAPGDYVGGGVDQTFASTDGTWTGAASFGDVAVAVSGGARSASFRFRAACGQPLGVGSYLNVAGTAALGVAALDVEVDGRGCSVVSGHFTVLEAVYAMNGDLVSFAADFEQHCYGDAGATGSVRYHVGDAGCTVDGVACNDRDACTATSTCQGGACVGGGALACGAAPDVCHGAPLCDPAAGQCLSASPKQDFTACDDGNPCTTYEYCMVGTCTPQSYAALQCADADTCTDDYCDPTRGCVHDPIPGTCGVPGETSSFLFVERGASAVVPGEQRDLITGPGAFYGVSAAADGTLSFQASQQIGSFWMVRVASPTGQIVPGTYEGAVGGYGFSSSVPGLHLSGNGLDCGGSGRFVVYEASYAGDGSIVSFAADFSGTCTDGAPFRGAVRYRAGLLTCRDAPDGTPCDDRNGCTQSSVCRSGICVGNDPVPCSGSETCATGARCDPLTGGCLAGTPKPDGTACSEPEMCAASGACRAGVCEATPLGNCYDGNVCTDDVCVAGPHCEHPRIAGSCWTLNGTVALTATALGQTCSCSQRFHGVLALRDDGRFTMPGGVAQCPSGEVVIPDEVGTWRPDGDRLVLQTSNLDDLTSANSDCANAELKVKGYRTTLRLLHGGQRLRGKHVERDHAVGSSITLGVAARFRGVAGNGRPNGKPPKVPCATKLVDCLRAKVSGG